MNNNNAVFIKTLAMGIKKRNKLPVFPLLLYKRLLFQVSRCIIYDDVTTWRDEYKFNVIIHILVVPWRRLIRALLVNENDIFRTIDFRVCLYFVLIFR
jgi:hypothetical protein